MSTLPSAITAALEQRDVHATLVATAEHFGCQAGTVHLLNEEGLLVLAAAHNIPPPVQELVRLVPIGKGIAGAAAERREPVTVCNIQADPSGVTRPGAKATGMEGAVAVPMLLDGQLRGTFGIAKTESYDWPKDETDLLLRIASELAKSLA